MCLEAVHSGLTCAAGGMTAKFLCALTVNYSHPPHSLFASDAYDDIEKILAKLKLKALDEGDSLACPKPPVLLFGVSFTRIFSAT